MSQDTLTLITGPAGVAVLGVVGLYLALIRGSIAPGAKLTKAEERIDLLKRDDGDDPDLMDPLFIITGPAGIL